MQLNGGLEGDSGAIAPGTRPEELDATQLTHADILNRVCAQLDLGHPKELIPFSIRVSNLLAFGNKLQAFVHEVCSLMSYSTMSICGVQRARTHILYDRL